MEVAMEDLTRRDAYSRRSFTLGLASFLLLSRAPASAQSTAPPPKVAILSPDPPGNIPVSSFLLGLTELGYVDGQTVSFEFRFANNALERLPALAAELVATQPDVIWTWTSGAARAAASATATTP